MNGGRNSRVQSIIIGSVILLSILGTTAMTMPVPSSVRASGANTNPLLQFTSGGHALGFTAGGMYAANGSHALHVDFVNANHVQPQADSAKSEAGKAVLLGRVAYTDLWDGITLTYTASAGEIYTTTYTLAPAADAKNIRLRYNSPITLESDGTLAIAFDSGRMTESAPVAWQEIHGQRVPVEVSFQNHEQEVSFALGSHDPRFPLTIDPSLTWVTFLGGSENEIGGSIAMDGSGDVYIQGNSYAAWGCSPISCTVRAFHTNEHGATFADTFVAKLDSSGSLVWNTFLGGNKSDYSRAITLDQNGNIYVAGYSYDTWSCSPIPCTMRDFTTGGSDAFIAKLDSSGNLLWNTFLGTSANDWGYGIAVDESGMVYVTGDSYAAWGCPLTPCTVRPYSGSADAYVAKLDSSGNLLWNTFLGGSWSTDVGTGIAVDGSGNIYIAGWSDIAAWGCSPTSCTIRDYTSGNDYLSDAFVAKLDSSGNLTWNTFLGGNGDDSANGIAIDSSGNIYVAGGSDATWGNPVRTFGGNYDVFAVKLNSSGAMTWNTFLGGNGFEMGYSIAVDDRRNAYVTGPSADTWGSPDRAFTGGYDAFTAKLNPTGVMTWNTFLGGSLDDIGYDIVIDHDDSRNVYATGISQTAWNSSPVRPYTAANDVFATKLVLPLTISGNAGVGGADIDYGDDHTTADGSGNYTFTIPDDWSGIVTPSLTGYTFNPPNRDYSASPVTDELLDQNFTATPTTYTLTVNSPHGTVAQNPDKTTYTYGEVVGLTSTPDAGWSFANWTGDAAGTTNPTSVTMDGIKSVTANYTRNEYTLTITSAHGTVNRDNPGPYHYGDVVQLTSVPDAGWSFVNWGGDASGTTNPVSVTINGNTSVTANYTQNVYTLTVTSAHGTVNRDNPGPYHEGDVVQLTSVPDAGWSFVNWSGDAGGTTNPVPVTMNGNKSVTANYTVITHTISGNAGVPGATLSYMDGIIKTFTADDSGYYSFAVPYNWSGAVTPSLTCYTFNPPNHGYSNVASDQTAQNYTPTLNPGCANVNVSIAGTSQGTYVLPPKGNLRPSYAGGNNGPVRVTSSNGTNIIASERVAYTPDGGVTWTDFSELMGLPSGQLTTSYVMPWYNNVDLNSQLRFGNVGSTGTTVTVKVAGAVQGTYNLLPSQSARISYAGLNNGPVQISSSGGVPIIASERVAYYDGSAWTSFSELMGLPSGQLTTSYVMPWYNNVDLNSQLRFGNVGSTATTVTVKVAGVVQGIYPLAANQSARVSYAGLNNGPVQITSLGGVPIIASERVTYYNGSAWTSFSELMGLPSSQLTTSYALPVYDNASLNTQLRFGNVGSTSTNVTVTVGGVLQGTYTLVPSQSVRVSYAGLNDGPVVVSSSGGVPIIVSDRVAYYNGSAWTSFSEMMGLPATQLTTSYVLPWYNNVDLNTQLRFAVP